MNAVVPCSDATDLHLTGTSSNLGLKADIPECYVSWNFSRFRKICEMQLSASSYLSVRPSAWNNSAPTGWIFMKFDM